MKTIAVISCYNEVRHIGEVVTGALKYVDKVIVSDDGSTDETGLTARTNGAKVVRFEKRMGAGHVHRYLWGAVNAQLLDVDIFVLLDGDGQHDPADIPVLLQPVQDGVADVVMGNRLGKQDHRPLYRRASNHIGTWLANLNSVQKVDDAITGFWAIRADKMPVLTEKGWGWAIELLMKCRADKLRIVSVPVKAIWHKDSRENSTLAPIWLGLLLCYNIIKWRLEYLV